MRQILNDSAAILDVNEGDLELTTYASTDDTCDMDLNVESKFFPKI
jgi:hypothetical protein